MQQPRDLAGRRTIAGLFSDRESAQRAIEELKAAGFPGSAIGVAMRDRTAADELVEETGTVAAGGATTGLIGGSLLGGVVGYLVGLGALAIPGIGPVVAGGALAAAFGIAGGTAVAGVGIGAAAGTILGALIGMGIPEEEARHFETGVRSGGTIVTVAAGDRAIEALAILERNGADSGPGSVGHSARIRADESSEPPTPYLEPEKQTPRGSETGAGIIAGAASGAVAGTAIGGPVGTVIGGVAGAAAGAAVGAAAGSDAKSTDEDATAEPKEPRREAPPLV
jgi:outer membrane lipoprotein SlyB